MELFEKVSDDLLVSILLLADYETVCRCRAVCRSWNSALSDSKIRGALAVHRRNPTKHHRRKVTFLIQNRRTVPSLYVELRYDTAALTLTPLNFLTDPFMRVRASSSELLLLSSSPVHYYLYNTLTKQSVSLPEAPNAGETPAAYGLVSEEKAIRVVQFHSACLAANGREYHYTALVFAWETWSWTTRVSPSWPVTVEENLPTADFIKEYWGTEQVVEYMGALYWHNVTVDGVPCIVRFDPYGENGQPWGLCSNLPIWSKLFYLNKMIFIGKCWGQLRYGSLAFKDPNTLSFTVWRMAGDDDDHTRLSDSCNWYLQHVNTNIRLANHLGKPCISDVSFHPFDQHLVFFYDVKHVFQYDMSSNILHPIAKIPERLNVADQRLSAFTIAPNLWPTFWLQPQSISPFYG